MADLSIQKILLGRKNDYIKTYSEGSIKYVVYNRPNKSNAYTLDMYMNASEAIRQANKDSSVKFIVIYGEGKNFSTGNDLANFTDPDLAQFAPSEIVPYMAKIILQDYAKAVISSNKPIFAIVQGMATGVAFTQLGLYDKIYGVEGSTFHAPLVQLAQGPQMCSSYTFPKYLGIKMAVDILIEGNVVSVDELAKKQFLTKVSSVDQARRQLHEYISMLDKLDYPSLLQTRNLMKHFQRSRLLEVNQMQCRNLVERWLHPKLPQNIFRYINEQKKHKKSKL